MSADHDEPPGRIDRRPLDELTWPKIVAVCGTIIVALGGGLIGLGEYIVGGLDKRIDSVSDDTSRRFAEIVQQNGERFSGREAEERSIREAIQQAAKDLGDRIVASDDKLGARIDQVADAVNKGALAAIQRANVEDKRFISIEAKLDTLLTRTPVRKSSFNPNPINPDDLLRDVAAAGYMLPTTVPDEETRFCADQCTLVDHATGNLRDEPDPSCVWHCLFLQRIDDKDGR